MADNASWYVVHTYSGYENTVKATIEKYVENRNMRDLIHEISIPMETVTKMVMNDETWHVVRNIRGVTGFLGEGNKAIPLSDADVAALGVEKREVVVSYEVGDSVRITDGALESFLGTVEEIDLDRSKVRVVVSMFGRETPVELELDQRISRQSRRAGAGGVGGAKGSAKQPHFSNGGALSWHRK